MKKALANHSTAPRRLVVNPWMEEFAAVPLRAGSLSTYSVNVKCTRKLVRCTPYLPKPSGNNRLTDSL